MTCKIDGCERKAYCRGWCKLHYDRWQRHGDPLKVVRAQVRQRGTGTVRDTGHIMLNVDGIPKGIHTLIAEKVLGHKLPKGVVVHHVNEDPSDNRNENLVICTQRYHMLIHRRMRAMAACGNPSWLLCSICKQYSPERALYAKGKSSFRHRKCHTDAERIRRKA